MATRARNTADGVGCKIYPRSVFFTQYWHYKPGESVTALCPYGGGKTQLMLEALDHTAQENLPATFLIMKPRDKTISRFIAAHKEATRTVRDWPPTQVGWFSRLFSRGPRFWVLWPAETGDPEADDARHTAIFRRCLRLMYVAGGKRGKKHRDSIIFADETFSLEQEMGLTPDLRRIWTKGRSLGVGLWAATQRPAFISKWAYQAQHIFIGNDSDLDAQRRYGEIGANFDPVVVRDLVAGLKPFQFLYISREDRSMCIVDAS